MSILLIPFIWFLDRMTKDKAVDELSSREKEYIYKDKISLRLVYNKGAFLGLFKNRPIVLHLFTITALVTILIMGLPYWLTGKERLSSVGLAMILGGALGNYTDRLTRGHVIDFIAFAPKHKLHYNIADFAIFIGAGLLVVNEFFK